MNEDTASGFPVTLLITLFALAFVLVLAWLALKLLAKSGAVAIGGKGGRLRVLQSVPVGARERVVLLEVDGEELLLGVAAGGVQVLARPSDAGSTRSSALDRSR